MLQRDVAAELGVNEASILDWELNRSEPTVRMFPQIIAFLGYDPYPEPKSVGQRIAFIRRATGLSRKRLAVHLGCDEATVARWEAGRSVPPGSHLRKIESFYSCTRERHDMTTRNGRGQ